MNSTAFPSRVLFSLLTLLVLGTLGCGERPERPVREVAAPQRLISLLPSVTEAIFTVGAGDRLVGVTLNDKFPEEVQNIERVGGLNIDYERVLALQPDLVILDSTLNKDGPKLKSLGIKTLDLHAERLPDITKSLARLTERLDCGESGILAQKSFEEGLAAIEPLEKPRNVFIEVWGTPLQTAGSESLTNDLISHLNLKNIYQDQRKHFQVNTEDLLSRKPDFILVVSDQELGDRSEPSSSAAELYSGVGRTVPVVFVSGDLLTKPTVRVLEGLRLLKDAVEALN